LSGRPLRISVVDCQCRTPTAT